jgi:AraC-like DNA-binding protein
MESIFLIGTFNACILLIFLFRKKRRCNSDKYLFYLFLVYALTILGAWSEVYNNRNGFPFPSLLNVSWLLLFLHGPFLWFYVKSLTEIDFSFKRIHLIQFAPFLLFGLIQLFSFILLPAPEKIRMVVNEQITNRIFYIISNIAIGISMLSYNICVLLLLRLHRNNIRQYHSMTAGIDLKWLNVLTIASLSVSLVNVMLFNLNNVFHFAGHVQLTTITHIFAVVYILFIGYYGLQQKDIFINYIAPDTGESMDNSSNSALENIADGEDSIFLETLIDYMEHQRPYLDPDISLANLSNHVKVKPEYLSRVINSSLNQNFFDFINKYRVEEFKRRAINLLKANYSILGIAYECGFNSKASFYRAFKKFEKQSPSVFIKALSVE